LVRRRRKEETLLPEFRPLRRGSTIDGWVDITTTIVILQINFKKYNNNKLIN